MPERLTREEATALLGPTDDATLAEILELGLTRAELAEARAWIDNDEAMVGEGRGIPTGHVARVIEILKESELDEDADPAS
jgi:hypothetical protein